jgi:hypothetical protein
MLPALRQQSWQPRWRDALGQGNAQLAVIAVGCGLHTVAGLLQGGEDAGHML